MKDDTSIDSWEEWVLPYAQHECTDEERRKFEAILAVNSECAERLREVEETLQSLREAPEETLSRDLSDDVLAALEPKTIAFPLILKWAAGLVLIFGLWFASFHLFSEEPEIGREAAVGKGLDWLVQAQSHTGAWDAGEWGGQEKFSVGLTGLALISLIHGEEVPPHPVRRATTWLMLQQQPAGNIGHVYRDGMYNHCIATLALLESYEQSPFDALKLKLDKAIQYILNGRQNSGGWDYVAQPSPSSSAGVSFWPLLALHRAEELGWKNVREAKQRGLLQLTNLIQSGDAISEPMTLTAMSVVCLAQKEVDQALADRVAETFPAKCEPVLHDGDIYRGYFLARGLASIDQQVTLPMLDDLQSGLVKTQQRRGRHSGSWDLTDAWSSVGGRIYTTSMATMTLMVDRLKKEDNDV